MNNNIIKKDGESYYFSLWADPACLSKMVNQSLRYVWIIKHHPSEYVDQWWKCKTQLKEGGAAREMIVRGMSFDIQMETKDFLVFCEEFSLSGIIMFQTNLPIPASLFYYKLDEKKRRKILIQNGVNLGIEFPILDDLGIIWSPERKYLDTLLDDKEISKLAYYGEQ